MLGSTLYELTIIPIVLVVVNGPPMPTLPLSLVEIINGSDP